ncbi:hypothetical protein B5P43_31820 [Bacillus sp. SRB_336]|nr:hypothetical protein B5P43_31820 [Bacillus sp. SRB_336]
MQITFSCESVPPALLAVIICLMAFFTTRQKQSMFAYVFMWALIGGVVVSAFKGNVWCIIAVAIAAVCLFYWLRAKYRAADAAARRRQSRRASSAPRSRGVQPVPEIEPPASPVKVLDGDRVELNFKIPVQSDDTLDSLTLRIIGAYQERGGSVDVGEARAMAAAALEKYLNGPAPA